MKQYKSCIQNNNNNNNNNNKKDKNEKRKKKKSQKTAWERRERLERILFFIFLHFASFSDLWKSNRRFSLKQKAKLIHEARATRGYQNLGVSSNSTK